MSRTFIAVKSGYFFLFCLLLFHFWLTLQFYLNQFLGDKGLKELNKTIPIPESILPRVLDVNLIDENEICNTSEGYEEYPFWKWPGTHQGIYIGPKVFRGKFCSFTDCSGNDFQNYVKSNCTTSNDQTCCHFAIDTPFPEKCKDTNTFQGGETCECLEVYRRKSEMNYNKTIINREVRIFDEIQQMPLFRLKGKKMCYKSITNFILFDSTCQNGVFCFGYICLNGMSKCPDYSVFSNYQVKTAISEFDMNYNNTQCSLLSNNSMKTTGATTIEGRHYLSKIHEINHTSCILQDEEIDDIKVLEIFRSEDLYKSNEIYSKIISAIDRNTKDSSNKYSMYLNDTIRLTARTHFTIAMHNDKCKKADLFQKVENSFHIISEIISAEESYTIIILDTIFLLVMLVICLFFLTRIRHSKFHNEDVYTFRVILIANTISFLYNFIVLFSTKKNYSFYSGIAQSLDDMIHQKCFSSSVMQNFLIQLHSELKSFIELRIISSIQIVVENGLVLVIILLLTIPLVNIYQIIGIKKRRKEETF